MAKTNIETKNNDKTHVIVLETGAIKSIPKPRLQRIISEGNVYCPEFCKAELEQISQYISGVNENLKICKENEIFIDLKHREFLIKKPRTDVNPRWKGVVALCCYFCEQGHTVKLYTTSYDIKGLAEKQRIGIIIEMV